MRREQKCIHTHTWVMVMFTPCRRVQSLREERERESKRAFIGLMVSRGIHWSHALRTDLETERRRDAGAEETKETQIKEVRHAHDLTVHRMVARRNLLFGRLKLLSLLVARPAIVATVAWFLLASRRLKESCLPKWVRRCGVAIITMMILAPAKFWRLAGFPNSSMSVKSGVYHSGSEQSKFLCEKLNLSKRCSLFRSFFLNGDWSTILPVVVNKFSRFVGCGSQAPRSQWCRTMLPSTTTGEFVCTDWLFPPNRAAKCKGVCVVLPGVAGGKDALYIQNVVERMHNVAGWSICCLQARGMGSAPPVHDLKNFFDPNDSSDLADLVSFISSSTSGQAPVILVGFSLGAIQLGKFMCRGTAVPKSVVGSMLVSGAFDMAFSEWWRYKETFQKAIVPDMALQIMNQYAQRLDSSLLPRLARATSYRELVLGGLQPITGRSEDYEAFAAEGNVTSYDLRKIDRPTLFLTAVDDPLHEPGLIGLERAIEAVHGPEPSRKLVVAVTDEGGHVLWPDSFDGSSNFLQCILEGFAEAAVMTAKIKHEQE